MSERKWLDPTQPQTLQMAVLLCYINAALALLYLLFTFDLYYLVLVLLGVAAYGIANERRWAYYGAIGLAGALRAGNSWSLLFDGAGFLGLISLLFAGVLFALLIHPQSRAYQRIWFR